MDADQILDRRRLKRRLAIWRTVAIVALVAAAAAMTARYVAAPGRHVARLAVSGIIVEDPQRDLAIDALQRDDDVEAVIVSINSPGGTTAGSEALYHSLLRVAEEKPVVAVIGTIGASGGYIVALAADHVVARETSLTGSIGVLMETAEVTGLLEKLGITAEARRSAPLKGQPSPFEPMSNEVRAALDEVIADSYAWFVDLVAKRRRLDAEEVTRVSDGRVFTGRQAIGHKLIDAIGGEREARAWLEAEREVSLELPVQDVRYGDDATMMDRFADSMAKKVLSFEPLILDGLVSVWHPR